MNKKAAHFLNTANLWNSPPNDALNRAYAENGYDVEYFAPDIGQGQLVRPVQYGFRWLIKNLFSSRWAKYSAFSSTSENPIVIAGVLAFVWRKPLIFLSDEIKSGSYSGDRPRYWKKICQWAMRRAVLTIVNDDSRIKLQKDYARLNDNKSIVVYPGCFLEPPLPQDREVQRKKWHVNNSDLVLCFSGACNLTAGIDWALESLEMHSTLHFVMQPLAMDEMHKYLLSNHRYIERIFIQNERLNWQQSWQSMGGADIGIAIYTNQAPQFLNMGISSNRLCMFLAMGVPVIVNKQKSFEFLEEYNCGVMVSNQQEFNDAIDKISTNLDVMKLNTKKCMEDYVNTAKRYDILSNNIQRALIK